jgi:MFS transporter, ACS family, allantoate permease
MLVGLNDKGHKAALLFGKESQAVSIYSFCNQSITMLATYLIGTFGSALSTIYAYNASNTGGATKKVNSSRVFEFNIRLILEYARARSTQ